MPQSGTPESVPSENPPLSISAAGQAYQLAMQASATTPTSIASPAAQPAPADIAKDVVMSDSVPDGAAVCPISIGVLKRC